MAVSDAFLATCRTRINATAEKTALAAALTDLWNATRSNKGAKWQAAFGDGQAGLSPAYRLRKAIRDVVTAHNGGGDGTYSQADIEAAYRTLAAEYVPAVKKPLSAGERNAILADLMNRKQT